MKTRGKLTLAILLAGGLAFQAHAQSVTLGDVTFDANSDQMPADWYYPMSAGTKNYVGYGDNEGSTRTETCSLGETLGGVKCIKRVIAVSSPDAADVTENWWFAIDTNGDIRVIKCSGTNLAGYDAFGSGSAPLFLPGLPADGRTWELFGRTLTVSSVGESEAAGMLEVSSAKAGTPTVTCRYVAKAGLFTCESRADGASSGSGWSLDGNLPEEQPTIPDPE